MSRTTVEWTTVWFRPAPDEPTRECLTCRADDLVATCLALIDRGAVDLEPVPYIPEV